MTNNVALAIETMVAMLLMLTIGYCWLLNRRLNRLRADEGSLKATISELVTATDIAGRAISGLKQAVRDCDAALGDRLTRAERLSAALIDQIGCGEDVVRRIALITAAAGPAVHAAPLVPGEPANTQATRAGATLAAAQAFVRRNQERQEEAAA